jgi:hypothetical protein
MGEDGPDPEWKRRVAFLRSEGATAATFDKSGNLLRIELGPAIEKAAVMSHDDLERETVRRVMEQRLNARVAEERRMRVLRSANSQLRGIPDLDPERGS